MNISDFHAIRGMSVGGRTIGRLSKELSEFLQEHRLAEPVRVEYRPHASAEMANCFRNVEAQVQKAGGKMETGWAFFELVGISIHNIAHAIWITRFGKRVDITPWQFPPGSNQILFLPDERVASKRGYTAGWRTVLSKDERIRTMEFFDGESDKIFEEFYVGMGQYMDIPKSRFVEAAERHGIPWEVAKERVDYAFRNHGHCFDARKPACLTRKVRMAGGNTTPDSEDTTRRSTLNWPSVVRFQASIKQPLACRPAIPEP